MGQLIAYAVINFLSSLFQAFSLWRRSRKLTCKEKNGGKIGETVFLSIIFHHRFFFPLSQPNEILGSEKILRGLPMHILMMLKLFVFSFYLFLSYYYFWFQSLIGVLRSSGARVLDIIVPVHIFGQRL